MMKTSKNHGKKQEVSAFYGVLFWVCMFALVFGRFWAVQHGQHPDTVFHFMLSVVMVASVALIAVFLVLFAIAALRHFLR